MIINQLTGAVNNNGISSSVEPAIIKPSLISSADSVSFEKAGNKKQKLSFGAKIVQVLDTANTAAREALRTKVAQHLGLDSGATWAEIKTTNAARRPKDLPVIENLSDGEVIAKIARHLGLKPGSSLAEIKAVNEARRP